MRKIEQQMNRAVVNKNNWSNSNTFVEYNSNTNCSTVVLHRTAIAVYDHNTQALKLKYWWMALCHYKEQTKCYFTGG